jgi:hypothetical protein
VAIAKDTADSATVQRVERGWVLANLGEIEKDGPLYNVRSSTGRGMYVVDLRWQTCECEDWKKRKDTCKRLIAATPVAARG